MHIFNRNLAFPSNFSTYTFKIFKFIVVCTTDYLFLDFRQAIIHTYDSISFCSSVSSKNPWYRLMVDDWTKHSYSGLAPPRFIPCLAHSKKGLNILLFKPFFIFEDIYLLQESELLCIAFYLAIIAFALEYGV